ncbi:MAG: LegC family aminotransferase [Alphaproteobacteria bacterium]|nr:MAG: LegC family aminotransferase [Alphaproteobacteria bacterium]
MDLYSFQQNLLSIFDNVNLPVGLHEPTFDHYDIELVSKAVHLGWVSYQGEMVQEFEDMLSAYLNIPHVITTVSGTSALFLALNVIGVRQNDEVIMPSLTFVATANAVCHLGAIPHLVDSGSDDFNIALNKLDNYLSEITTFDDTGNLINKKTKRIIRAMVPVHVLGSSCDLGKINYISTKYNLKVVEDSAEALGSKYKGKRVSGLTGLGIISFNGNKIITTGGGGAIVTHNKGLAYKMRHLSTTAKKTHKFEFEHDDIGFNLRMPALNAALGCSQLEKIDKYLLSKRELFKRYVDNYKHNEYGSIYSPDMMGDANCWLNAFVLNEDKKDLKDVILNYLIDNKIFVRPFWKPLHMQKIYARFPRSDCCNAENHYSRVICLPSSVKLVNHG